VVESGRTAAPSEKFHDLLPIRTEYRRAPRSQAQHSTSTLEFVQGRFESKADIYKPSPNVRF
jgi:hypothetical protein